MKAIVNNQQDKPLKYYKELYRKLDPESAANRCLLPYSHEAHEFGLDFIGNSYGVAFPDFDVRLNRKTVPVDAAAYDTTKILIIRYIIFGAGATPGGKFLTYREVPWGETYSSNFESRSIKRLAQVYGSSPDRFRRAYSLLGGTPILSGDEGCELRFMSGLTMRFLLWTGDEDFPPSAQILFSDNFPAAFSAEDMAVIGELCVDAFTDAAKICESL